VHPKGKLAQRWQAILAIWVAMASLLLMPSTAVGAHRAVVLEIRGAIGPAIADYMNRKIKELAPSDAGVVVLRMDTPGGLDTAMREMIRDILASPVPVVVYVAPSGARAASAGTYILYASAVAAMAPGTNLGAATPIQLGLPSSLPGGQPGQTPGNANQGKEGERKSGETPVTEPTDTESRKIINDAVAYIRSLAELNGRNADWAADAVRSAVSLPASEALKLHVIDVIAEDVPDLLQKIDGRIVTVAGKSQHLETAGLEILVVPPDWRTRLLAVITDPNIAFLLMLIGIFGLVFEATTPGVVFPGVVGGICLLTALFALDLLPIDLAGAALVFLGIGLMVAEVFIGTFGVIGAGGIVAFAIGAIMMFPSNAPGFALSTSVVAAATVVAAGFFMLALATLIRSRRHPVVTGSEALIGADGEVVAWTDREGKVRVKGEIWRALAQDRLQPGTHIKVIKREGLALLVEAATRLNS
jgi:membrane-bound serine protease (ClpP class)